MLEVIQRDLPPEVTAYTVDVYLRIFQLETWLRELVYLELKARFGATWWAEANEALKRSHAAGISAEKSLKADSRHPHMSTPENDPLWFLSFDSLLKIIFDRKLWKRFETYLTTRRLLKAKFEEISPIRNRIAHCRSLHPDDLERLTRLMKDIDQGFWNFCTSYNNEWSLEPYKDDPILGHFAEERLPSSLELGINYSVRPSFRRARRYKKALPREGRSIRSISTFTYRRANLWTIDQS